MHDICQWYTRDTKVYSLERFPRDTMQEGCTVNLTVRYIARKWTLLILLELYKGEGHTRRFSELKSCLSGITQKVLSARLRELEKEGLVDNKVDSTSFPVKSEYSLTESGLEIISIIKGYEALGSKMEDQQHRVRLPAVAACCEGMGNMHILGCLSYCGPPGSSSIHAIISSAKTGNTLRLLQ